MSGPDRLDIADLLRSMEFARLSTLLEKGGHVGPEDGTAYDFLRRHVVLINEFYATWQSTVVETDECYHLLGDTEHFGRRHLGRQEMLVGAIACSVRLDPGAFSEGLPFDDFVQRMEMAIGSADLFVQLFATQQRVGSDVERRERARLRVERCLRELESLGFLDFTEDAGGERRVLPRTAIHRFSLPAQASGGDPSRIGETVDALVGRGILHRSPVDGDDE
jgi:chromosome partition protein MukE